MAMAARPSPAAFRTERDGHTSSRRLCCAPGAKSKASACAGALGWHCHGSGQRRHGKKPAAKTDGQGRA